MHAYLHNTQTDTNEFAAMEKFSFRLSTKLTKYSQTKQAEGVGRPECMAHSEQHWQLNQHLDVMDEWWVFIVELLQFFLFVSLFNLLVWFLFVRYLLLLFLRLLLFLLLANIFDSATTRLQSHCCYNSNSFLLQTFVGMDVCIQVYVGVWVSIAEPYK